MNKPTIYQFLHGLISNLVCWMKVAKTSIFKEHAVDHPIDYGVMSNKQVNSPEIMEDHKIYGNAVLPPIPVTWISIGFNLRP